MAGKHPYERHLKLVLKMLHEGASATMVVEDTSQADILSEMEEQLTPYIDSGKLTLKDKDGKVLSDLGKFYEKP